MAFDVGGTKVASAIVRADGEVLARHEEPTSIGVEAVTAQIVRGVRRLRRSHEAAHPLAVGIGFPAVLEPGSDRVLWAPKMPGFANLDLRQLVASAVDLPVFLEYDGHAAALGEWWMGAGRGYQDVVTVVIGTGLGGGMILDGQLYRGAGRLAGMAGWFQLSWCLSDDDPARTIGEWDFLASGPGIARRARERIENGQATKLSAESVTAERVLIAARAGDALALPLVDETARIIGAGVANIVSLVDPEVVVLGGSVGRQPEFLEEVRRTVTSTAHPFAARRVRIEASKLGADAVLLGAAYAAWQRMGLAPPEANARGDQ